MTIDDLTGRWVGHYLQHGRPFPIAAELLQKGEGLTGSMTDGQTESESTVYDATSEAGLAPGADEQIEARVRELVPDAGWDPIRYVSHVPTQSLLEGRFTGQTVRFVKTYQGTSFGGFRVGKTYLGVESAGHAVSYEGRLSDDGRMIEGRWWIDADTTQARRRVEGEFNLKRSLVPSKPPLAEATTRRAKRPWWRFWS